MSDRGSLFPRSAGVRLQEQSGHDRVDADPVLPVLRRPVPDEEAQAPGFCHSHLYDSAGHLERRELAVSGPVCPSDRGRRSQLCHYSLAGRGRLCPAPALRCIRVSGIRISHRPDAPHYRSLLFHQAAQPLRQDFYRPVQPALFPLHCHQRLPKRRSRLWPCAFYRHSPLFMEKPGTRFAAQPSLLTTGGRSFGDHLPGLIYGDQTDRRPYPAPVLRH